MTNRAQIHEFYKKFEWRISLSFKTEFSNLGGGGMRGMKVGDRGKISAQYLENYAYQDKETQGLGM